MITILEAMKYVAPVSQSLGISLEDTAAAVGLLSNANIKGSQSGTVLRQTMARLASPTSEAAKIMQKYGINAFDAQGNMKPLSSVVDNLNGSLGKLTSQQRADVISTIFGTESMSGVMALMNQGGQSLSDLSQKLKDTKGSADEMANTKLDNLAGQWEQLKGSVETAQIQLGEKLAPHTKEFVTWLTNKIPVISETIQKLAASAIDRLVPQLKIFGTWLISSIPAITQGISSAIDKVTSLAVKFNGLNTSTKNSILSVGLLTLAFGPLSSAASIIGGLGSGIGKLVNLVSMARGATATAGAVESIGLAAKILPALFSPVGLAIAGVAIVAGTAIIANNNLMKKSITTTTEELGSVEKIMNELHGHMYKSKKEMVDLGLVYDDFGKDVSDSFKKAAQESSKSLLKLEMNINRLTTDGVFDEKDNTQLKNWANQLAYEGVNAIKEKQAKIKSELSKTFSLDGVTSTAEQGTLDYMDKFFGEGVNKELEIRNEMYAIGDKAIKNHGKLLEDDLKQLKEKAAELQQIKLEYANAESAGEQAYARSKFTSAAERVTGVDGASELLQERAKEHQKAIDDSKANYARSIKITQDRLMSPNLSHEDRNTLETQLKETTAARDKGLKEAEENYKSDLLTLYEAYPKAKGILNEDTGEKFSGAEIKSNEKMNNILNAHSGTANITESGVYSLMNNNNNHLDTLYIDVDETTKKIKGVINGSNGDIEAYSSAQKEKLNSVKEKYSEVGAAMQLLINSGARVNIGTDEVTNRLGAVGTLTDVQTAIDGTKTGILDLNGTPFKITADVNGAITDMQKVKEDLANIDGKSATVTVRTQSESVSFTNEADAWKKLREGYATGTSNATTGIHPVAERGYEIVFNRQNKLFQGGEKVLNHEQSKSFIQNQQNEPFKVKQGQYQLAQPQQVATAGGNSVQVDVQVNGGNQKVEELIVEVTQEVGRKLKEAFTNIKK